MIRRLLLFTLFFNAFTFIFGQSTEIQSIVSDQLTRSFRVHFPSSTSNTAGRPLVINMHGYTSDAVQQEFYSRMSDVSNKEGFIVVYPDGISNAWNVGWGFGSTANDVQFISDLIDYMVKTYHIDQTKVYACGMSNGGFMSYYLACHLGEKIAAIASVTGSMVPGSFDQCASGVTMPVLEIHGNNDQVVPFGGLDPIALPIEDVVQFWVQKNGCNSSPSVYDIPNTNVSDNTTSKKFTYNMCDENVEVQFILVDNGAHTWPGGLIDIDITSKDFSASEEIWNFFKGYSRNIVSTTTTLDKSKPTISVYANGIIQIQLDKSDDATLFNMAGQNLKTFPLVSGHNTISLVDLPSGAYTLHFSHYATSEKVIKL